MTAPYLARASNLVLAHGSHIAVRSSTFEIPSGCTTAVIGPNGSGKSTLLHALAGLLPPHSGTLGATGPGERWDTGHVLILNLVQDGMPDGVADVAPRRGSRPR